MAVQELSSLKWLLDMGVHAEGSSECFNTQMYKYGCVQVKHICLHIFLKIRIVCHKVTIPGQAIVTNSSLEDKHFKRQGH